MTSRCLSAAGLRFLDHLLPPGDFRPSYEEPTDRGQTPWGFPRSALSSCNWGGCLLYSGVVVSLPGTCGHSRPLQATSAGLSLLTHHCRRYQSSCPATTIHGASTKRSEERRVGNECRL